MTNGNKQKSTLEQLKELQKTDTISSLDFKEPELKGFDASNIFEIDETEKPEKKPFIFGKRAHRHASQVKIKTATFENDAPEVEDIMITSGFKANEDLIESESNGQIEVEVIKPEVESQPNIISDDDSNVVVEPDLEIVESSQDSFNQSSLPETEDSQEELEDEELEIEEESSDDEDWEYEEDDEESDEDDSEESLINDSNESEAVYDEEDDLFVEKKKFLLSQYGKEEAYLEQKSKEGFHFVRHVGKKFYFFQAAPANYYYSVNYFAEEPSADDWRDWEADGWKLVSRSPAKKKREAGWFIFRNTEHKGEYRKEIDNEEEKYRFMRKYANSCRSTMFLIFMCMALCAVAAFLQWEYKGYIWGFAICGVVFFIAFIVFCMYGRMLRNAKKATRILKAKLRTKERRAAFYAQNSFDTSESEEELDTDWNTLENETTQKHKMKRKKRNRD